MRKLLCIVALVIAAHTVDIPRAVAVDPNPLQSAYWRFEEGVDGTNVASGADVVLDSINANNLRAGDDPNTAPRYTSTAAPLPLQSGLSNNLAFDFTPHAGGGDDLFTNDAENCFIRNGMIGPPVAPDVTGFTLEAAFRPDIVGGGSYMGIVSKEGMPPQGPEPTLALKVRGDSGNLQIELIDQEGTRRDVQSTAPLTAGQWYAAAAVNDGSTLSLYLNDGSGYVLQGSTSVSGALYQGGTENSWDRNWTIGRAAYNDGPADWFDGIIDEVRLSNSALAPSEFLFVPEPSTVALAILALIGGMGLAIRRRRD